MFGEWVLISTSRNSRPFQFFDSNEIDKSEDCPFCLENMHMTPKEIFVSKSKLIRIVPNKYPILDHTNLNNMGIHDVVIDTADHGEKLCDFSLEHLYELFQAIIDRIIQIKSKCKYVQLFKNEGKKAGASLKHSHFQIIGLSFVPRKILNISQNFEKYYFENNECIICNYLNNKKDYIILSNNNFTAFVEEASFYASAITITSNKHISSLTNFNYEQIKDFSVILKKILKCYYKLFFNFNYNLCFYSLENSNSKFHFFVQIIPRSSSFAGFELSTNCFVNSTFPEETVKTFKELLN